MLPNIRLMWKKLKEHQKRPWKTEYVRRETMRTESVLTRKEEAKVCLCMCGQFRVSSINFQLFKEDYKEDGVTLLRGSPCKMKRQSDQITA